MDKGKYLPKMPTQDMCMCDVPTVCPRLTRRLYSTKSSLPTPDRCKLGVMWS